MTANCLKDKISLFKLLINLNSIIWYNSLNMTNRPVIHEFLQKVNRKFLPFSHSFEIWKIISAQIDACRPKNTGTWGVNTTI